MRLRNLKEEHQPTLMVIPMIDIIFFLLVFFMFNMLTMVSQKTIALQLPNASTAEVNTQKTLPIAIDKHDGIWLEDQKVSTEDLASILRQKKRENDKLVVVIRGDQKANYGIVISVLDTIKSLGIDKVTIATEKTP